MVVIFFEALISEILYNNKIGEAITDDGLGSVLRMLENKVDLQAQVEKFKKKVLEEHKQIIDVIQSDPDIKQEINHRALDLLNKDKLVRGLSG